MAKAETVVSCPFCRRVYKMLLDREAAERTRARASCGRCGNSFELAARVAAPNPARAMPPPPEPPSPALAKMRRPPAVDPRSADADDLALDDLVRDIAHAAEQIVDAEKTAPARITSTKIAPPPPPPPPATRRTSTVAAVKTEPAAVVELTAEPEDLDLDAPAPSAKATSPESGAAAPPSAEPAASAVTPAAPIIESVTSPPRIDETPTESAQTAVFWAIKPAATPEQLAAAGLDAAPDSQATPTPASSPSPVAPEVVASVAPEVVAAPARVAVVEPPPPPAPKIVPEDWLSRADPGLLTLTRAEGEAARVLTSLIG